MLAYTLQIASSAVGLRGGLGLKFTVEALENLHGVIFTHKLFSLACFVVSCEHC